MKYERLDDPCAQCVLEKDAVKTKGFRGAKILVVTKTPRENQEHPLSPQALTTFSKAAKLHGFKASDFIFHPAIRCSFDAGTFETKEKHTIQKCCREWLTRAIERHKPSFILALGAEAASAVEGRKVAIMKARGNVRRKEDTHWGCPVLYTLDPEMVNMYPQHRTSFEIDFKEASKLVAAEFDPDEVSRESTGKYKIVDDLQFLIDMDPTYLDFDIEAVGLKHAAKGGKIMTMQFCVAPGEAYAVVWDHPERRFPREKRKKMLGQLRELLCNPKRQLIGQNLKFDAVWMLAKFGIRLRIFWDTLMLYTLLDENSMDKSQDMLVKQFVPEMAGYADAFNNKYDKSRMDLVPLEDLVEYGCGDVDSNIRLFHALLPKVKKDKLLMQHYRHVSRPALNAFVPIEADGQLVSEDNLDNFQKVLAASIEEQKTSVVGQIDQRVSRKWLRKHQSTGLSLGRRDFLRDILFEHPHGCRLVPRVFTKATDKLKGNKRKASTSTKDHLPFFFEHPEHGRFVSDLSQLLKDQRLYDTNVVSFRKKYMIDGKIYPSYSLTTAVTGRTASRDPNGQNFPKRGKNAKAYRSIFVPPPGWVLLECDLSQAELRVAADMANEQTMLEIYRSGGDIHRATACMVMGITEEQFFALPKDEQKLARYKAKAVNFGYIYGMGWRKFIIYAKTQYGVDYTDQEARNIRDGYFRMFFNLPEWHKTMRTFARMNKYVRSYSGRVRHLPMIDSQEEYIQQEAERQAINSPVQEFGSSYGLMSMGRIDQEIDRRYLKLIGFVHDALYAYVPAKYVEWGAKTLKRYMETNNVKKWFGVELACPIVADVGFGFDGSAMFEMESLDLKKRFNWEEEIYATKDWKKLKLSKLPPQKQPQAGGRYDRPDYMDLKHVA